MELFGTHVLPPDGLARLSFGALEATVQVRPDEWRIVHRHGEERDVRELVLGAPPVDGAVLRVATDTRDRTVVVGPTLPDADVVMRTDPPLQVLPGSVAVHVGTPIGLAIRTAGGATLAELPSVRLDRTWFGPSVRDGELLLSMRSHARLSASDLPRRPFRAATVLTVRNVGKAPFSLERLRLPVPHLSLYRDPTGRWWTETVEVVVSGGESARLSVGPPPDGAGRLERVLPARRTEPPNPVLRALDALFAERT
jgi:hypothetical protein